MNNKESSNRSPISRRAFLGGGVAVAGGLAIGTTLATRSKGSTRKLQIANWPYYIDTKTVPNFEKATGVKVEYTEEIEDNSEYLATIEQALKDGQDFGRDLIVVTDWMAAKMIFAGYARRLDRANVPNKINIVASQASASFDPNRVYSLPWLSGMTGIAYDTAKVKDVRSIDQLLDPALSGKVALLSESRDTIGLLLLSMGKDPASCTPADIKAAFDKLNAARKKSDIKIVGADYIEGLKSGDLVACMAWAGDLVALAETNPTIRWVVPDAGGLLYTDNMIIPRYAKNADLAEKWMNFVYDTTNAANIIAETPYLSPVKGAIDELRKTQPELADSVLLNPSADMMAKLHSFRYLDDKSLGELDEQWAAVAE